MKLVYSLLRVNLEYRRVITQCQSHLRIIFPTRTHSSRMRTAHSSNSQGGSPHPPWEQTPPWSSPPPGQTPQLPPWVWAWKPARHAGIPPPRPAARHAGIPPAMHAGIPLPPVNRITDTCKNITLPQIRCGR